MLYSQALIIKILVTFHKVMLTTLRKILPALMIWGHNVLIFLCNLNLQLQ